MSRSLLSRSPASTALLAIAALCAVQPAAAAAPLSPALTVQSALRDAEARVITIGHRLAVRAANWCDPAQLAGWILSDTRLYPRPEQRAAAKQAYGFASEDMLFVAALAPDGAAARGGAVVGASVDAAGAGAAPFARIETAEWRLRHGGVDAPLPLVATPAIRPDTGCATDWRVQGEDRLTAAADGTRVFVSAGFVRYLREDGELAALLAHELAHNILAHRARLDAAGLKRGLAEQFGRNARLVRATEREADRLSVWLLARAGFDPHAAIAFRTRYGRAHDGALRGATHDRWPRRVALMQDEIAAMRTALAADPSARPPLIDAPTPLE